MLDGVVLCVRLMSNTIVIQSLHVRLAVLITLIVDSLLVSPSTYLAGVSQVSSCCYAIQ